MVTGGIGASLCLPPVLFVKHLVFCLGALSSSGGLDVATHTRLLLLLLVVLRMLLLLSWVWMVKGIEGSFSPTRPKCRDVARLHQDLRCSLTPQLNHAASSEG